MQIINSHFKLFDYSQDKNNLPQLFALYENYHFSSHPNAVEAETSSWYKNLKLKHPLEIECLKLH